MDNHREIDADRGADAADVHDLYDGDADDAVMDAKHSFGTDERRMHVRAYNFWAALLGENNFPSIEDLNPAEIDDFGSQSVLLDFTAGLENPAIQYLGEALAEECGIDQDIGYISQVPARSLLSRITDHYMQIIANQAPIGFEAEFVNQRGATIMYRGILLPFSSDDDTIDFICGVINWKEMADQATTDELMHEVDKAILSAPRNIEQGPVWADGPLSDSDDDRPDSQDNEAAAFGAVPGMQDYDDLPAPDFGVSASLSYGVTADDDHMLPSPSFASLSPDFSQPDVEDMLELTEDIPEEDDPDQLQAAQFYEGAALPSGGEIGAAAETEAETLTAESDLSDWLQQARSIANDAQRSEERSRSALYNAVGRAYDFSVMAAAQPEKFQELLDEAGVTIQERAPMTPVVKLVFGINYDKTRLTEYATALSHAHRETMAVGDFAHYLSEYKGGLKAVVREERRVRREEDGEPASMADSKLQDAYAQLRSVSPISLDEIETGWSEFVVLVARRDENGTLGIVAARADDDKLTDRVVQAIAS